MAREAVTEIDSLFTDWNWIELVLDWMCLETLNYCHTINRAILWSGKCAVCYPRARSLSFNLRCLRQNSIKYIFSGVTEFYLVICDTESLTLIHIHIQTFRNWHLRIYIAICCFQLSGSQVPAWNTVRKRCSILEFEIK